MPETSYMMDEELQKLLEMIMLRKYRSSLSPYLNPELSFPMNQLPAQNHSFYLPSQMPFAWYSDSNRLTKPSAEGSLDLAVSKMDSQNYEAANNKPSDQEGNSPKIRYMRVNPTFTVQYNITPKNQPTNMQDYRSAESGQGNNSYLPMDPGYDIIDDAMQLLCDNQDYFEQGNRRAGLPRCGRAAYKSPSIRTYSSPSRAYSSKAASSGNGKS